MNQDPRNSTISAVKTFSKQHVLNDVKVTEEDRYWAKVVTQHRAPDLYDMIFGTSTVPKMKRPNLRLL